MAEFKYKSPGVTAQDLGFAPLSPANTTGRAAAVVGTAPRGPAFVPVSFGDINEFKKVFGTIDGTHFGPLAVNEWMKNSLNGIYLRVLGAGDATSRGASGEVSRAGFTVGERQPSGSLGYISDNPFANAGGPLGRTYFLGCFMSESAGSTVFSSAGLQGTGSINGITSAAVPIVRGILMAPSGVILRLSSSFIGDSSTPSPLLAASEATAKGSSLGAVTLKDDINDSQKFVLIINGLNALAGPTVITASFDMQSPIYFGDVFNTTASLAQEKGHYLAARWDIHPSVATLTGTGVVTSGADAPSDAQRPFGKELSAFLLTSSLARDVGSSTVPNYESFRDRFSHASTPWFISQKIDGAPLDLFRLHALDAGADVSNKYKITISNITPPAAVMLDPSRSRDRDTGYGTFDISVRTIYDSDVDSRPLEVYSNIDLNPSSDNFISKKIGDLHTYYDFDRVPGEQKIVVEGNYPVISKYLRVEVHRTVEEGSSPAAALPFGFRGLQHIVTSGSSPLAPLNSSLSPALVDQYYTRNVVVPPLPMRLNNMSTNGLSAPSPRRPWGLIFDHVSEDSNDVLQNKNISFEAFTAHYPTHNTTDMNFAVGGNTSAPDTASNGVVDSDRFCRNLFTLENVKIVTGSSGFASAPESWNFARYVRSGDFHENPVEKSRPVSLLDFCDPVSRNYLTFTVVMQGGFDGVNIFDTDERTLTSAAASADMLDPIRGVLSGPTISSYKKALEILSEKSVVDMSLLAIPGIREPHITDSATAMAETRMDTFYMMDIPDMGDVVSTVDEFKSRILDSTYAAAYYPDVVMKLTQSSTEEFTVPPTVVVLGSFSLNDAIGAPWTPPTGTRKGRLISTLRTKIELQESDLDLLYSSRINPLYAPTDILNLKPSPSGVVVWGQKTQCRVPSALERIDVRRMLIEVRAVARSTALRYMFAPANPVLVDRITTELSALMGQFRSGRAFEQYRVEVDPLSNTRAGMENSLIKGRVFIKPNKSTIFLPLDFIVSTDLESEL